MVQIGILLYGSYVIGGFDEFSDIDVLIVVDNTDEEVESRGSYYIDGINVEYFIETEKRVYLGLYYEIDNFGDAFRNRFLLGKIIYDTDC